MKLLPFPSGFPCLTIYYAGPSFNRFRCTGFAEVPHVCTGQKITASSYGFCVTEPYSRLFVPEPSVKSQILCESGFTSAMDKDSLFNDLLFYVKRQFFKKFGVYIRVLSHQDVCFTVHLPCIPVARNNAYIH